MKIMEDSGKKLASPNGLFLIFCIWIFVLLCRPQDFIPALKVIRPALLMALLMFGVFLLKLPTLQKHRYFDNKQIKRYIALIFIMISGIPFSLYARLSFMTIFTEYINVIIFVFVFYKVIDTVQKLSTVIIICCIGSGFYAFFSITSGNIESLRLSFGQIFDPNDLAFYALGFLPLNLVFVSRDNPVWARLVCLGVFGISVLMILLTGSRGGLIALGVAVFFILMRKTKTVTSSMRVMLISICLFMLIIIPVNIERYMTIFNLEEDYNVKAESGRIAIWMIGLRAMLANPITGVGVACFANAVGLERSARGAETLSWQPAHNSAIQIGTETGVIGLVIYLLISFNVFLIFTKGGKMAKNCKLAKICEMGFVGFAGLFISGMFLSQAYSVLWAFFVAISAVVDQFLVQEKNYPHISEEIDGRTAN